MKKIFITFTLLFILLVSGKSQEILRYGANKVATTNYTSGVGWSDWTEWKDCNYTIYFCSEKSTIKIIGSDFSTYIFTIVTYKQYTDDEGLTNFKFNCVDQDADKCIIRFKFLANSEIQCFIIYEYNVEFVYNCKALD